MQLNTLIDKTCDWLFEGNLDPEILAADFHFSSPFHKEQDLETFIDNFKNKTFYKDRILAGIKSFDPILKFHSEDGESFSIVLQYHTHSGHSVWETVLGTVNAQGKIKILRSIYDLNQTNQAHGF